MNQNQKLLDYLKTGRSITALEALSLIGTMRLAARIENLRKEGHEIETETVHSNGKRFAKYFIKLTTPDAYKVQGLLISA